MALLEQLTLLNSLANKIYKNHRDSSIERLENEARTELYKYSRKGQFFQLPDFFTMADMIGYDYAIHGEDEEDLDIVTNILSTELTSEISRVILGSPKYIEELRKDMEFGFRMLYSRPSPLIADYDVFSAISKKERFPELWFLWGAWTIKFGTEIREKREATQCINIGINEFKAGNPKEGADYFKLAMLIDKEMAEPVIQEYFK